MLRKEKRIQIWLILLPLLFGYMAFVGETSVPAEPRAFKIQGKEKQRDSWTITSVNSKDVKTFIQISRRQKMKKKNLKKIQFVSTE